MPIYSDIRTEGKEFPQQSTTSEQVIDTISSFARALYWESVA